MPKLRRANTIDGKAAAAAALIGSVIGFGTAVAQEPGRLEVDVSQCVELESPEARLACFEAQVDAEKREREHAAADPSAAAPAPPPGPTDARSSAPPAAPQGGEVSASAGGSESGAASAQGRDDGAREFVGTVTALRETLPNSLMITLDNGQVWRQMRPKWYPLRTGQRVRVYSTNWGTAFRLEADDINGFIQVERVR